MDVTATTMTTVLVTVTTVGHVIAPWLLVKWKPESDKRDKSAIYIFLFCVLFDYLLGGNIASPCFVSRCHVPNIVYQLAFLVSRGLLSILNCRRAVYKYCFSELIHLRLFTLPAPPLYVNLNHATLFITIVTPGFSALIS